MEENKAGTSNTIRIHEHEGALDDDQGSSHGSAFGGEDRNQSQPVAEFLYQLTKMLTDDNSEIIEWTDGRIKVHYPERLEGEVLHKYFRHSKCTYSSRVYLRRCCSRLLLVRIVLLSGRDFAAAHTIHLRFIIVVFQTQLLHSSDSL